MPYWPTLKLRHSLDAMHIEKYICDSVLGAMMNIDGKTNDTINVQKYLREMGIRKELHLQTNCATTTMPLMTYTLTRKREEMVM